MSTAQRDAYRQVVKEALAMMRPHHEPWSVTAALESPVLRLDFAHGTEAPRSFNTVTNGDDVHYDELFRLLCFFLKTYWPTDEERPS